MSRHHRPFSPRAGLLPAIILALVLTGCASAASGNPRASQTTTTASTSGGSTPTATSTTTTHPPQTPAAVCTSNGGSPLTIKQFQVGHSWASDFYTWQWLPDNLPLTPQKLSSITPVTLGTIDNSLDIGVDMNVPASSQPGYICGVTVRIVSFQPLAGPAANVYHQCEDQVYMDPGGFVPTTACTVATIPAGVGGVTFATSAVGAEASSGVVFQPSSGPPGTPQPGAGQPAEIPQPTSEFGGPGACCAANDILVGVQVPQPGRYTFAVSLWQDSSGPSVTGPNVTAMFLFGQAQREWGGQPCTQPAMQSQLPPATNPPTQVICPGGAPTVQ